MKAEDIAIIARAMTPIVREFVAQQQQGLLAQIATLEQRLIASEQRALVPAKDGKDGTSVTVDELEPRILFHVERAVKALPVPQDGRSVTVEELVPVVVAEVTKAVAALPVPVDGKDVVGVADAVIDRDGQLVLTLTDGRLRALGMVVGKDANPDDVLRMVNEAIQRLPRPNDGEPGLPGRDGTLENLKVEQTGERSWRFVYKDGQPVEGGEFSVPIVLDRGVYVAGKSYEAGDGVTWGGSLWIAQKATSEQPETDAGASSWRLSVKRGRDGKVGPRGPQGERGLAGRDGTDLTRTDGFGRKA